MKKSFCFILLFSIIASSMLIQGCSSTSSDEQNPVINQAVSMEIFNYLIAELFTIGIDFSKAHPKSVDLNQAAELFLSTINEYSSTVSCTNSGTLSKNGTVTSDLSDEGTGYLETEIVQTINNCGITTSQGLFVVNGNPDFRSEGRMEVVNWMFTTFSYSFSGGYKWEGAGQSGECTANITYSINMMNPENFSMSGHMCGYTY